MNALPRKYDEYENLRTKIKMLQKANTLYRDSLNLPKEKSPRIRTFKLYGVNQFVSKEEFLIIEECFQKSKTFLGIYNKVKRKSECSKSNTQKTPISQYLKNKQFMISSYKKIDATENLNHNKDNAKQLTENDIICIDLEENENLLQKNDTYLKAELKQSCNKDFKTTVTNKISKHFNTTNHLFKQKCNNNKFECIDKPNVVEFDSLPQKVSKGKIKSSTINFKNVEENNSKCKEQKNIQDPDVIYIDSFKLDGSKENRSSKLINNIATKGNSNILDKDSVKGNVEFKDTNFSSYGNAVENVKSTELNLFDENNEVMIKNYNDMNQEITIPDWDFTEEPVDFAVPRLHINECHDISKELNLLEAEGVIIRKHKWSEDERAILKRNYYNFATKFRISDSHLLLGIGRYSSFYKSDFKNVKKFLRAKHFLVRLAKDLNTRTLNDVYCQARNLLDPYAKRKATDADISKICNLQKKYGNRWSLISQKCQLPIATCQSLFEIFHKPIKKGKWSEIEIAELLHAIIVTTGVHDLATIDSKQISYKEVAKLIPTRNARQCRLEWVHNQKIKFSNFKYQKWNRIQKVKLIYILKNIHPVDNESEMKWKQIYEYFKNTFPFIGLLKYQWSMIKNNVAKDFRINYNTILNYL